MTDIALQNDASARRRRLVLAGLTPPDRARGMMGSENPRSAGVAARLSIPFVDADAEIEKAAGMSIADIFARHGEADFRNGEARVIARLLEGGPQVLATGGGAFMNADTRAAMQAKAVSIWLSADFDVLVRRVSKRKSERPLLQTADPAETLRRLLAEREPIYALADLSVRSRDVSHDAIVAEIMTALAAFSKPAAPPHGKASP
jgi:shikimate kinase